MAGNTYNSNGRDPTTSNQHSKMSRIVAALGNTLSLPVRIEVDKRRVRSLTTGCVAARIDTCNLVSEHVRICQTIGRSRLPNC